MACLDTTTLVDLAGPAGSTGYGAARAKVRSLRAGQDALVTTRLNVAELLVGVSRSSDPAAERTRVEALLRPLVILEFDARSAEVFGRVVAHLQERGTPLGDMDALIASVCLANGHRLVTRNTRHFSRIPGLQVVNY